MIGLNIIGDRRFIVFNNLSRTMNLDWPNPEPKEKHLVLEGSAVKEKIFIVGDVHGCLDELKELLVKSEFNPSDTTLILVGDLVNKGPYSAETVNYVRNTGAYCVRGNHDESALTCALKIEHKSARNYAYAANFTRYKILNGKFKFIIMALLTDLLRATPACQRGH